MKPVSSPSAGSTGNPPADMRHLFPKPTAPVQPRGVQRRPGSRPRCCAAPSTVVKTPCAFAPLSERCRPRSCDSHPPVASSVRPASPWPRFQGGQGQNQRSLTIMPCPAVLPKRAPAGSQVPPALPEALDIRYSRVPSSVRVSCPVPTTDAPNRPRPKRGGMPLDGPVAKTILGVSPGAGIPVRPGRPFSDRERPR